MFPRDFMWGAATAAYQVEGGAYEDGRGESIWDVYAHTEGKIEEGHTGDVACDHYHRYQEDIALMKKLGIKMYRFSLSWSRILPNGVGEVNQKGLAFYHNLIDGLLDAGIEPCITLYHWDFPYALELRGGWLNPDSPKWFEEYARVVFEAFADKVRYFLTFNEPQCFVGLGHKYASHAPGLKRSEREIVIIGHNVMKAHGMAVRAFREATPNGLIGYAPCCTPATPATGKPEDVEAARRKMFDADRWSWVWSVSWWSDPVMLGRYPEETEAFQKYGCYLPEGWREDMELISTPIDFYGQNIYQGDFYRAAETGYELVKKSVNVTRTSMGWSVVPESLYWGPRFLYERYGKPVLITENGVACDDGVALDGGVHDPQRIDFMHRYLREISRAMDDGVELMGYMYWSLMDNFEWAYGYTQRFGLIYIDYETLERIPKDSFAWYQAVIQSNGEGL